MIVARCVDPRRLTVGPARPVGRCTSRWNPAAIVAGDQHRRGSRKLNMPHSRAWFSLIHRAEPDRDLGRHRSVSTAVICTLVIGSVVVALAASRSLDVTSATAEEPIAPIPEAPAAASSKIALGQRLFADPRLSGNRTRSCASCHDVSTNGATKSIQDTALDGSVLPLNTSSVFNATLSFRFNWEEGFRTLESQALASLQNPRIMGAKIEESSKGSARTRTWFVNSVPPTGVDQIPRTCWMPSRSSSARS